MNTGATTTMREGVQFTVKSGCILFLPRGESFSSEMAMHFIPDFSNLDGRDGDRSVRWGSIIAPTRAAQSLGEEVNADRVPRKIGEHTGSRL